MYATSGSTVFIKDSLFSGIEMRASYGAAFYVEYVKRFVISSSLFDDI
jgi:hypothetical protein